MGNLASPILLSVQRQTRRMCTLQGGIGLTCVALGLRLVGNSEHSQTAVPLVESLLKGTPCRYELPKHVCLLDRLESRQLTPVSKGLSVSSCLGGASGSES